MNESMNDNDNDDDWWIEFLLDWINQQQQQRKNKSGRTISFPSLRISLLLHNQYLHSFDR